MERKVIGITLKKTEYRDNTAIATIFTSELGIIQVTAYGIHSIKKGVSGGLQSLVYGEFTLTEKNGRYILKSADVIESFGRLYSSYEELCSTGRIVRAAMNIFSESSEKSYAAFNLLYAVMSFMAYSDSNEDDIYIYFLLQALNLSGQCPAITNCAICGHELFSEKYIRFVPTDGGACCFKCTVKGMTITPLELEVMRRILLIEPKDAGKVKLNPELRKKLLSKLEQYYEYWY